MTIKFGTSGWRDIIAEGFTFPKLRICTQAIAEQIFTPPVRYSKPGIQAHITYLYSMTGQADQRVPRDAVNRHTELRKQLDAIQLQLSKLLGPAM